MKMTVLSLTSAALLLGAGAFAASAKPKNLSNTHKDTWVAMPCFGA